MEEVEILTMARHNLTNAWWTVWRRICWWQIKISKFLLSDLKTYKLCIILSYL